MFPKLTTGKTDFRQWLDTLSLAELFILKEIINERAERE